MDKREIAGSINGKSWKYFDDRLIAFELKQ